MWRLAPLALLAACAELPPVEGTVSSDARQRAAPILVPLDPLLAEGSRPGRADAERTVLTARGTALGETSIPAPRTDDLDARARRLQDRADALRAAEL
ncbi:hypothetical protein [uncultured Jannaschia sp.]|uniref:hypothetical protein n=1 Tax=uncultured Jannaschia sp. TaxID=293347 RepID=UPI0026125A3A|nr:hypothetical protein [uncultured Jannaschia sp.]